MRGQIRVFHDPELIFNIYISPQTLLCGKIMSKYRKTSVISRTSDVSRTPNFGIFVNVWSPLEYYLTRRYSMF